MKQKFFLDSNQEQKLYLVELEFISGEYGQMFERIFEARDETHLGRKVFDYIRSYYPNTEAIIADDKIDTWLYHDGEVGAKYVGFEEINGPMQVIKKLMVKDFGEK